MNEKRDLGRNILLTLLACVLLFGFALAIPSGDVSEELADAYAEEEDSGDEYDFL